MIILHKKSVVIILAFLATFFSLFSVATAQTTIPAQPQPSASLTVFLQWVFDAGMAIGFTCIIIAFAVSGIYFILSSAAPEMRSKAKEWLTGAISGLLVFLLFYLILTTVNPDLAFFKFGKGITIPSLQNQIPSKAGVYFYTSSDCTGNGINLSSSSPGLSSSQKIGSIQIIPDSEKGDNYFAVLYSKKNYEGACQYIQSNCTAVTINEIGSVLIKTINPSGGPDVSFYRNPSFNQDGGYLTVAAGSSFEKNLKDLQFTGSLDSKDCNVPQDKQDCIKWDNNGNCIQKQCPNLEGKNISSISLNKNYVVILSYWGPNDKNSSTQTYCQTYPAINDISSIGPKQIKWDAVDNDIDNTIKPSLPYYPNYVRILSVK